MHSTPHKRGGHQERLAVSKYTRAHSDHRAGRQRLATTASTEDRATFGRFAFFSARASPCCFASGQAKRSCLQRAGVVLCERRGRRATAAQREERRRRALLREEWRLRAIQRGGGARGEEEKGSNRRRSHRLGSSLDQLAQLLCPSVVPTY